VGRRLKKLGIVGGTAWLSTVDYYAALCELGELYHVAHHLDGPPAPPEMSIESLDLNLTVALLGEIGNEASWARFDAYHRDALRRLELGGADFAIMASNTPHARFAEITRGIGIPVINIFDAVAKQCAIMSIKHLLLFGTALTTQSPAIGEALARAGVDAIAPNDEEQAAVERLIAKLQRGQPRGVAERVSELSKISYGRRFEGRPIVCLACTELPLAFPEMRRFSTFKADGVTYINSASIHTKAAFEFAIS